MDNSITSPWKLSGYILIRLSIHSHTHSNKMQISTELLVVSFTHIHSKKYTQDFDQNVWWLISSTDNIMIGYWPCDIFSYLYNIAVIVEWGGDVYSPRMHQEPHTATAMGSSNFASDHWSFACFIHQPRIKDYSMTYKYPYPSFPFTPDVNCYSGENYAETLFTEPLFYFGGPGRNLYCP